MRELEASGVATLGAYSYPVAAQLIGVSSQVVRTWSKGYTRKVHYSEDRKRYAPVLQTKHEDGYVTFLELIELLYCREFRKHGVQLTTIRTVAERLSAVVGPYPFASKELLVSGRALVERISGPLLLNQANQQVMLEFGECIKPNVVYDTNDRVRRMFVDEGNSIILSPSVRFGEPVLASRPVPVRSIVNLFQAEGELVEPVADYFQIAEREVQAAVKFASSPKLFAA